jgi:outer membrane protein TolC
VFLCGVASCTTVRRARHAQEDAVPAGERTVTAAEAGLSSNTVLSLEAAERIALAYQPSVTQARQSLTRAAALVREARAAYLPSASASAGYRRSTKNSESSNGSNKSSGGYSGDVSLDQVLFDFGRTPAACRQAALQHFAAESTLRARENDAVYAVRLAYYELGRAQELQRVAEDTERQFRVRLEQTRTFAEVGRRIRYDVTKAEVDLGNARLAVVNTANSVLTARAELNRTLGLAEEPGFSIEPVQAEPFKEDAKAVWGRTCFEHPELDALRAEEAAASAAVDAAIADLYPSLGLSAAYQWSGSGLPLVWNWALGGNLGASLFSGGRKAGRIDGAVAQLRVARAAGAAREQQLRFELSKSWAQLESAQKRMDLSRLIVRQARESLDLVQQRFNVGGASSVEVTDAQVALTKALAEEVQARFDYQEAVASIKRTAGGR